MKQQRLCPVYLKWLQLHPVYAREHRVALQKKAQAAHQTGNYQQAQQLGYQAFEAAKVVLLSLQTPKTDNNTPLQEDVLAFGTMAMYLASVLAKENRRQEALEILQECQQQLIALMPLHATNPAICKLIGAVQHSLEQGSYLFSDIQHNPAYLH